MLIIRMAFSRAMACAGDQSRFKLACPLFLPYERRLTVPLGLILYKRKSSEQIELLELDKSGIRVAEYLTQLPEPELLKQKLHKVFMIAREQMQKKWNNKKASSPKYTVKVKSGILDR